MALTTLFVAVLYAVFASNATASAAEAVVTVDFSRETGPVKPMHGIGQPPMAGALAGWSMMHYLKEAGIPYARLHDVGDCFGGGLYVDIPNLFPDFDADENDSANYRFAYTDSLMNALEANGKVMSSSTVSRRRISRRNSRTSRSAAMAAAVSTRASDQIASPYSPRTIRTRAARLPYSSL